MRVAGHASLPVHNGLYIGTEYIAIIASILLLAGILLPAYALSTEQAKLTASDPAAEDAFGGYVSISGDTAVVGSPFDDDGAGNSGSAYVFVRSAGTWTEQAKLTASDPAAAKQFGRSVSISGDTAVVGSPFDDDAGESSGSAYVFVRSGTTWMGEKITASDAAAEDLFGRSVSISGDTAIIGAVGDDDEAEFSGAAYVYMLLSLGEVDPVDARVPVT